MSKEKRLTRWAIAAALVGAGVAFAYLGGRLFTVLNLPVWSDGTKGWNYPGVISYVIFVAGITVFNTTLKEKARFWFWAAVIALAVILLLY
ncbi:MAG: hypothetical protein E7446_05885 [Ruminococcaceae bacterium]|nr:hypothetical protein [Oscillospiraceae bacterium]